MLRRDPTLVSLRDTDVQEIKELAIKRQQEAATAMDPAGGVVPESSVVPPQKGVVATEQAKKERQALSRNQRLGLE